MLTKITIGSFISLVRTEVALGQVNVPATALGQRWRGHLIAFGSHGEKFPHRDRLLSASCPHVATPASPSPPQQLPPPQSLPPTSNSPLHNGVAKKKSCQLPQTHF
ncbi:MAG: hypothetical protein LBT53_03315 [Puniceicoccales bacterium]|nr:hypothetical protein [Puniceicoccales bacterium]